MADSDRAFWLRRARREAFRFNFGWWVQLFLPWVFGLGILGAVGMLVLRTVSQGIGGFAIAASCLALAGMAFAWFLARKRFLSPVEALARLDADLGLLNRLSSAFQGIGDWPSPRPHANLALHWNVGSVLKPPLIAMALVAASIVIPLPKDQSNAPPPATASPPSWDSIQVRLDALQNSEIVQTEAIDALQRSLDALRNQSADQWYRHESLEAGDQLREQIDQSAGNLQEQLEIAMGVMETARNVEKSQSQTLAHSLDNALEQTIRGMEFGALPLNEQTLSQLKGLDSSKVRQLSSGEWRSLSEKLKAGVTASSIGHSAGTKAREAVLASILGQGAGDVDRGPGAAPLMLKTEKTHLGTTQTESVQNDDLSRVAVGDLAGLSAAEPREDKTTWTPGHSGGENSSIGSGSEAIWDQVATPDEQEALRRFFR
jgi:hypothetical protein